MNHGEQLINLLLPIFDLLFAIGKRGDSCLNSK